MGRCAKRLTSTNASIAISKKMMVLPITNGACKYWNDSGTPKNVTVIVRTITLAMAATIIVSGPTHTSLLKVTRSCDSIDLIYFLYFPLFHTINRVVFFQLTG